MSFAVQARRLVREHGVVVQDDTNNVSTATLVDARQAARRFADDGYTAWIFRVDPGPTGAPVYRMVETLRPGAGSTR